jgi:hypothetical protein
MSNFYCQKACGEVDFSIEEWNKAFNEVKDMSEEIRNIILHPKPCWEEGKEQCFACMAIVGETRNKNKLNGK